MGWEFQDVMFTTLLSVCKESCPGEVDHRFGKNNSTGSSLGVMREERTEGDLAQCPLLHEDMIAKHSFVPQLK